MGVMGATSRSVHFGAERDAPPQKRPTRGKVVGKPLPSWKGFSLWQKPWKRRDVVTFCPHPELVAQLRARSFPRLTRRLPPGERNLRLPIRPRPRTRRELSSCPPPQETHRQSGGCGQLGETTLHQPEADPITGRVDLLEDVDRDDRSEPVRHPRRRDHQAGAQDPTGQPARADQAHRRDARAPTGADPAGRLVCLEVSGS